MLWWINSSLMAAWWSQSEHPHRFSSLSLLVYCPLLLWSLSYLPKSVDHYLWSFSTLIFHLAGFGHCWQACWWINPEDSWNGCTLCASCLTTTKSLGFWFRNSLIFLFFILFFFEVHLLCQLCVHNYMELSLFRIITNILLSYYNGSFDIIVFLWKASAHENLFLQDSLALFLSPREKHICSMTIRSCAGFSVC